MIRRPLLLIVLDGWGSRSDAEGNAILARARVFRDLLDRYPHSLLSASGEEVK